MKTQGLKKPRRLLRDHQRGLTLAPDLILILMYRRANPVQSSNSRALYTTFQQCNFGLGFPELLSGRMGIRTIMHYGIVFEKPNCLAIG